MRPDYAPPWHKGEAFNCPHCEAYAHQTWYDVGLRPGGVAVLSPVDAAVLSPVDFVFGQCAKCKQLTVWYCGQMVYPAPSIAPPPVLNMPWDVQSDYQEARKVVGNSPRAAAALLRLALQKLMPHVGEKGNNINEDIGSLVQKGLPERVQKALDTVRVIGNNAVHPGQLDLKDDVSTALALFALVNMVVDNVITQAKRIEELYVRLPQSSRDAIQRRDGGP